MSEENKKEQDSEVTYSEFPQLEGIDIVVYTLIAALILCLIIL